MWSEYSSQIKPEALVTFFCFLQLLACRYNSGHTKAYIVMTEHDSLRLARGARGVDQDAALVGSLAAADVIQSFLRNIETLLHELLPLSQNSNKHHHSLSPAGTLILVIACGDRRTYRVKIGDLLLGLSSVLHYGFQMGQSVTNLLYQEWDIYHSMFSMCVKNIIYLG